MKKEEVKFRYMNVDQVVACEKYPFTKGQLRQFLIERNTNGFHHAVRKIGKRLYIRDDLFDEWIDAQDSVK